MSLGIVSGMFNQNNRVLIQTDAATDPGNSGGGLINPRGQVIGIPTMKVRDSQGANFAVASDTVAQFLAAPSSPAKPTAPGVYRGDPRKLAPAAGELDGDWTLLEEDPKNSATWYSVTYGLRIGFGHDADTAQCPSTDRGSSRR